MIRPANTDSIESATGIPWSTWVQLLEGQRAPDLPHAEIVQLVHQRLNPAHPSAGWWAQTITVAFEQHIGRRQPGQQDDGSYEVSIAKTIDGTMDEALLAWDHHIQGAVEFSDVAISIQPTTSRTEKWRHWHCGLADGTRVNVSTFAKSPGKSGLTVTHTKLPNPESAERWRSFWKDYLKRL
jgi:hypothetical protein